MLFKGNKMENNSQNNKDTKERRSVADFRGIKIQKQIVLPLSKAVEIAVKSMKIRFGRSLITTGSVVLAIAFLMSVWTTAAIENKLIKVYTDTEGNYKDSQNEQLGSTLVDHGVKLDAISQEEFSGIFGLSMKFIWLITLSLMVCLVGIINAMLMSVTERYREIGTMKCLGALDSFILKLFIIESAFQGLIGTLVGLMVGGVLAILIGWYSYGMYCLKYFPFDSILRGGAVTMVIGFSLSIIGAWYPARVAARMEPAVAMRSSE